MAALSSPRGPPLLLLLAICVPDVARGEEGGEGGSSAEKAVGITMMAGIFLVIGVFWLTHFKDHDIRKISWSTINNTLSIFCAVILFKNASQLGDVVSRKFVGTTATDRTLLKMNQGWVMLWYFLLFFFLYIWSGRLGQGKEAREDILKNQGIRAAQSRYEKTTFQQTKSMMKVFLFFAHTVGFAGQAGWALRMNETATSSSDFFFLVPRAAFWYLLLVVGLRLARRWMLYQKRLFVVEMEEDEPDELLDLAEEQLEDGENDFFGLMMSFLIQTTLRFWIGGHLPNEEGEEEPAQLFGHSIGQAVMMYVASAILFGIAFGVLFLRQKFGVHKWGEDAAEKKDGEEDEVPEEVKADHQRGHEAIAGPAALIHSNILVHLKCVIEGSMGRPLTLELKDVEDEMKHLVTRAIDTFLVNTTSFSAAFCFMYATQWLIAANVLEEGEELVLGLSLAIVVTLMSCVFIYLLDLQADQFEEQSIRDKIDRRKTKELSQESAHPRRASAAQDASAGGDHYFQEDEDTVSRTLIDSFGILIGFVWEQCFDVAVAGMTGEGGMAWLKPCLAILTLVVILPVWLFFIVPMETGSGYILGFVPQTFSRRLSRLNFRAEPEAREVVTEQFLEVMEVMCAQKGLDGLMAEVLANILEKKGSDRRMVEALTNVLKDPEWTDDDDRSKAVEKVMSEFRKWRKEKRPPHSASPTSSHTSPGYQPPPEVLSAGVHATAAQSSGATGALGSASER